MTASCAATGSAAEGAVLTIEVQMERLRRAERQAGEVFAGLPDAEPCRYPSGPFLRKEPGLAVPGLSAEVSAAAVRRRIA